MSGRSHASNAFLVIISQRTQFDAVFPENLSAGGKEYVLTSLRCVIGAHLCPRQTGARLVIAASISYRNPAQMCLAHLCRNDPQPFGKVVLCSRTLITTAEPSSCTLLSITPAVEKQRFPLACLLGAISLLR